MKIIVLIDFSLYTNTLVNIASNWAEVCGGQLVLVHEVPRLVSALTDDNIRHKIIEYEKEEALSNLEMLAKRNIPDRIPRYYEVTDKSLLDFLPQLISGSKDVLLMCGLKGTGLLKKIFIGSITNQVINELNELTVGVPIKINHSIPDKLTIVSNPDHPVNTERLDQIITLLNGHLSDVDFISIVKPDDNENRTLNYSKELVNKYKGRLSTSYRIFSSKNVFNEIKSHMDNHGDSFLVLQKGSRSIDDFSYRQFFINRIIHDGSMPLIVLPD